MRAGKLPRIIILDDCAGTRDTLSRVFSENLAADVFATANSEEALAQAQTPAPAPALLHRQPCRSHG